MIRSEIPSTAYKCFEFNSNSRRDDAIWSIITEKVNLKEFLIYSILLVIIYLSRYPYIISQ